MRRLIVGSLTLSIAVFTAAAGLAQPGAVHKTTLQTLPFPQPVYATTMVKTVVDPGGLVAPHTHPGVELAFIAAGQAEVKIAGRPDQSLTAGDSFSVPAQTVHSVKNSGSVPLTLVSTYVVDQSKPIAAPAH